MPVLADMLNPIDSSQGTAVLLRCKHLTCMPSLLYTEPGEFGDVSISVSFGDEGVGLELEFEVPVNNLQL